MKPRDRAARFAAAIEAELGESVPLIPGRRRGEFRVVVDGRTVVERRGGLVALLLRRPWPSEESVVRAVLAARGSKGDTGRGGH
ncbi:MAG: hypothetical protein ACO4CW_14910 [Planctomycetota bacterium]